MSPSADTTHMISALSFDDAGLIPAIAQQHDSGEVLMLAWMNAEAIAETLRTGQVCYYSRSRAALERGEDSHAPSRASHFHARPRPAQRVARAIPLRVDIGLVSV